ncbi:MAG UNVERIFIED_CONTAM: hypothetical protein LVT10_15965 [Anaerolineae bacterium]
MSSDTQAPALPLVLRLPVARAWVGTVQVHGLWGWHDHFSPLSATHRDAVPPVG